ncbi:MAG: hypothetical protein K8T25_06085 [Planctomycetia bacterium]|nr:hypothetical protein [Planctomycetia bacterium]
MSSDSTPPPDAASSSTPASGDLELTWVGQLGLGYAGIVVPMICFCVSQSPPNGGPYPDWQSGLTSDYAALLVSGRSMLPFYPLLVYSMTCMAMLLWQPARFARVFWIRFGIYSGVLLALQYCIVVGTMTGAEIGGWLIMMFCSAVVIAIPYGLGRLIVHLTSRQRPSLDLFVIFLILFVVVGFFSLVVAIVFATPLALAAYGILAIRLVRAADGPRFRISIAHCLAAIGWFSAWFAAWRMSVALMLEAYRQLPTKPPQRCYIATAAAQGHRQFVRSRTIRNEDGSPAIVNDQLRYLKTAELMLCCAAPRIHRAVRRVYDAVGPRVAAQIKHPLIADAAYVSLKPCEWAARLVLWLVLPRERRALLHREQSADNTAPNPSRRSAQ